MALHDFQMLNYHLTCFCFCEVEFANWGFFGLQGPFLFHLWGAFASCDLWRFSVIACCLSSVLWCSWLGFIDLHDFLPLNQYHVLCYPQINQPKPQYTCCWLIVWTVTNQISDLVPFPVWWVFWPACASISHNGAPRRIWDRRCSQWKAADLRHCQYRSGWALVGS